MRWFVLVGILVAALGGTSWLLTTPDARAWDAGREVVATRTDAECETVRGRRSLPSYRCEVTWTEDGRTVTGTATSGYGGNPPLFSRVRGRVIDDDPPTLATGFAGANLWLGRYAPWVTGAGLLLVAGAAGAKLRQRATARGGDGDG